MTAFAASTSAIAASIYLGCGIAGLGSVAPGSVALVINDPPWGATKAAWDRQLDWLAWWAAIDHALAPDGVAVVLGDLRLAVKIVPIARRRFSYDLVWRKNRASGHLNAKRQPLRAHELMMVFGDAARGDHRYEPQFTYGHEPMKAITRISKSELYGRETVTRSQEGATHRYQTSVLDVDVVPNDTAGRIHSSQKPVDLLRWLVRAYSRPGELVADPTAGSGAVLQAARLEGRRSIGWEVHEPYHDAAAAWIAGTDGELWRAAP